MSAAPGNTMIVSNDCWNQIGINGDASCPELKQYIHCRNCHVYANAGRGLLNRNAPDDYRREWGTLLAQPKDSLRKTDASAVVFSLGTEYLALPTKIFREVSELRPVHRVPGTRGKLLFGMVNIRGEIQLCVSLGGLLGLDEGVDLASLQSAQGRLLVVEHAGEAWVLPVNKVHGTLHYNTQDLAALPSTLEKSVARYSAGSLDWESHTVGCLNPDAVFPSLKEAVA